MIHWILLLICLKPCFCEIFKVNIKQSYYEAEEGHNITLEWMFTTKPDGPWNDLFIFCALQTDDRDLVLYQFHKGVEVSKFQDEQFIGRVQSDKDSLTQGQIRLGILRLGTKDSGVYVCVVETNSEYGSEKCTLNVTETGHQHQLEAPTLPPQSKTKSSHIVVGAAAAALTLFVITLFVIVVIYIICRKEDEEITSTPRLLENV